LDICILDAETLGEDIDLSGLEQLGKVNIYPFTQKDRVIERIQGCEIVITNKVVLDSSNLPYAPSVRLICVAATGTNNIDLEYARRKGIMVCNVAGYSTPSVVQHTFALLFYLLEGLSYYDTYVKTGLYSKSQVFTNLQRPFWELNGKTWGIIGLGTIGKGVAEVAKAFGCKVIYYSTSGQNYDADYDKVSWPELLHQSDIISIHAPLNSQTYNLLAYDSFQLMRPSAILLNLGRGGIVNEFALAKALDEGLIAGAALDVLEKEPIESHNPLLRIKNPDRLLITPHIAWASKESRQRLVQEIIANIQGYLNGSPRNQVI
jgi:lactate dehydrogenase-like 2-hydroxyacid dehydrogenase